MNDLMQINEAMDYLEKHLEDEIDVVRMARIAGCSEYHFRRMFSYLAGMSLGEYIRFRRLALAVTLLRQGYRVIDCAVLLGYDSADAFCKAFQKMHGVTPSSAKQLDISLKAFPPLHFQLTIKGGYAMDYRIKHHAEFRIVGFKKRITVQYEGINHQIDSIYEKLTSERITELKELCDIEPRGILNVSANFAERTLEGSELDQYIGVATTLPAPTGYDVLDVEASDWAVFTIVGPFPQTVQESWARIYSEWLPSSEYQLTGGPEFLWNESPDLTRTNCKSQIWIPVSKRS